ncbi:DUF4430 domain-containing protein [Candidatus Kaiserbacteria bacterium]|nr:DUF4430 domain-containing protein [Candidatus Kaiserbacteria bacterium]
MPKSFSAVSLVAITLVIFGLALSPRIHPAHTPSMSSSATPTTSPQQTITHDAPEKKQTVAPAAVATTTPASVNVPPPEDTATATTSAVAVPVLTDATLSLEGVSFGITSGQRVLDTMRSLQKDGRLSYTETEYPGLGVFIESINGKKNGGGLYWFLYVNGTPAESGASQTSIKTGDVIEWRYQNGY